MISDGLNIVYKGIGSISIDLIDIWLKQFMDPQSD